MGSTVEATEARRALLERLARPGGAAPLAVSCVGIGGTGLSGLARLLAALGHAVSGSDAVRSPRTDALAAEGIAVRIGAGDGAEGPAPDLVIATAALPADHPERIAALRRGVPVVKYAEALGALVAARRGVAIAGTHGKTTTTALTAHVLRACGRDPSWVVGGDPHDLPAPAALGAGPELVFEACEYDHSFRQYTPAVAVVLNVEEDHLDCYPGGLEEIALAFAGFASRIRPGGTLIVSADSSAAREVARTAAGLRPDLAIATVSLVDPSATFAAGDLTAEGGLARFTLLVRGEPIAPVRLAVPGAHNAANALAAIAAAVAAGVPAAQAAAAVSGFGGVRRRFEVLHAGDCVVVDDYAHHPTAVAAVIAAARARWPERRVVVCFEPHQASRTRELWDGFVEALSAADRVLLADVFICRDRPEDIRAVSATTLAQAVRAREPRSEATHVGTLAELAQAAPSRLGAGDVALFLGAGKISGVAHEVARALAAREGAAPRRAPTLLLPEALAGRLEAALGPALLREAPLAAHCTFKAGGTARFLVTPRDEEEAIHALRALRRHGVPVVPLGGGSNTLFASERHEGAVLLTRRLREARALGSTVRAAAGASLPGLIRLAEKHGLGGLEAFAGIPGTVGGAVFGNAGGPPDGGSVGALVARARVVEPDGTVRWRRGDQLGLRYRGSELDGCLVLSVDLALRPDDRARLRRERLEASAKKARTQPLEARSAGCVFRNPPGESAGRLIDGLGLKGLRRGGARVSPVHANFIVNEGGASPAEIVALLEEVRARVLAARGIALETELRLVA